MKTYLLTISFGLLFCFTGFHGKASILPTAFSARYAGMGQSSVMLYHYESLFGNQAGIAKIDQITIGMGSRYQHNLSALNIYGAGAVLPTAFGNFGVSFQRYGYSLYNENNVSLTYARMLGEKISTSVQFDYLYIHQPESYQKKGIPLIQLGFIAEPTENFFVGLHIYNPWHAYLDKEANERIPTKMRLGGGYFFNPEVLFTAETELNLEGKPLFKAGIQYEPVDNFYLRTGYISQQNSFTAGVGYEFKKISINYAMGSHPTLPIKNYFTLTYSL